jgi:hypothetical protein
MSSGTVEGRNSASKPKNSQRKTGANDCLTERINVYVTSIEQLLNLRDVDNKNIILTSNEHGEVWRVPNDRKSISFNDAKCFQIDGGGVILYGHPMIFTRCNDFKLINLTVRLGSIGFERGDVGEALTVQECERADIHHCHFGWGWDETVTVLDSAEINIISCIISEALDNPKIRKENGKPTSKYLRKKKQRDHAYGLLIRASNDVYIAGCLMARCRRRNPSASPKGDLALGVTMQNCIAFDYKDHGSKYNESGNNNFDRNYTILCNYYISDTDEPDIFIDQPEHRLYLKVGGNLDGDGNLVNPYLKGNGILDIPLGDTEVLGKLTYTNEVTSCSEQLDIILRKVGPVYKLPEDIRLVREVENREFYSLLEDETDAEEFCSGGYFCSLEDLGSGSDLCLEENCQSNAVK